MFPPVQRGRRLSSELAILFLCTTMSAVSSAQVNDGIEKQPTAFLFASSVEDGSAYTGPWHSDRGIPYLSPIFSLLSYLDEEKKRSELLNSDKDVMDVKDFLVVHHLSPIPVFRFPDVSLSVKGNSTLTIVVIFNFI